MKKKILTFVCLISILMLFWVFSVCASDIQQSTTEYAFEVVSAKPDAISGNLNVRLFQCDQSVESAVVIGLFYDGNGSFTEFVTSSATDSDSIVTLCPTKAYSGGKVTVWKSLSSVKPVAKAVEIGYEATASYTVEYYRQNVERSGYDLCKTSSPLSVAVGETVSIDTASLPEYDGFSFDSENSANVLVGIVTPDGLTLKVYYNHIVDEAALEQVIYRLEIRILPKLYSIRGNLTDMEGPVVKACIDIIETVLADANNGALIYIEDYISVKYKSKVSDARTKLDALIDAGGYADFKTKLSKKLSMADIEYLAKIMFGIDDIYQYEKEHL